MAEFCACFAHIRFPGLLRQDFPRANIVVYCGNIRKYNSYFQIVGPDLDFISALVKNKWEIN